MAAYVRMQQITQPGRAEEELRDLRLRFELLEGDKKAYYETSQWAIRRNKEVIRQLRAEISQLRDRMVKTRKQTVQAPGACTPVLIRPPPTPLERFDHRVCEQHKRADLSLARLQSKRKLLAALKAELARCEREAEAIRAGLADSQQARAIRGLENRLDKAVIKQAEAASVRKTYEQIAQRLFEERLAFDAQLAAFEHALGSKKADTAQLESMGRDAGHAKDIAKAELAKIDAAVVEDRASREKSLQAKKEQVKTQIETNQAALAALLPHDDQGLQSGPGAEFLAGAAVAKGDLADPERERKAAEYETIMRALKETMGISHLDEVVEKLKLKEETRSHLLSLQHINEQKMMKAEEKLQKAQEYSGKLKYASEEGRQKKLALAEEMRRHAQLEAKRCADAKQRAEKIVRTLLSCKLGIQHMVEKLEGIEPSAKHVKVTDETATDVLALVTEKLGRLFLTVASKEIAAQQAAKAAAEAAAMEAQLALEAAEAEARESAAQARREAAPEDGEEAPSSPAGEASKPPGLSEAAEAGQQAEEAAAAAGAAEPLGKDHQEAGRAAAAGAAAAKQAAAPASEPSPAAPAAGPGQSAAAAAVAERPPSPSAEEMMKPELIFFTTGGPGPSPPIVTISQSATTLPPNNCRVKLKPLEFELAAGNGSDDEYDDRDDDAFFGHESLAGRHGTAVGAGAAAVPDREMIKKQAAMIMNSKMKNRLAKKGKKKRSATVDSDD